jgi:uncharacterized protein YndB with AHSA1/START domain
MSSEHNAPGHTPDPPGPAPSPPVGERSRPPESGDPAVHSPAPGTRALELDVEVPGTPEEVWEAVASGPGISAWFVPAKVDGRVGGTVELDFGPGYGSQAARVTTWDPPRRFVAEVTGEGRPTFAAEWLVEARDGGTCVVRLINSGFGSGAEWDAEYDATEAGWRLFLYNLRLYLTHFPGQPSASILVNGKAAGPVPRAYGELAANLGLPAGAGKGDRVTAAAPGAPALAGVVERAADGMLTLLLEKPAPGVAFLVAEPAADGTANASVYAYLFGDGAAEAAARDEPAWRAWMQRHFPLPEQPAGS